jgi:hypothetical protein
MLKGEKTSFLIAMKKFRIIKKMEQEMKSLAIKLLFPVFFTF